MKRVIRRGVFETNSSSVHSLTMCSEEEFKAWKNGEVLLEYWDNVLVTKEEVMKKLKENAEKYNYNLDDEEELKEILRENEYLTYEQWIYDECLETFIDDYTTKGGENIIAFGRYGRDG